MVTPSLAALRHMLEADHAPPPSRHEGARQTRAALPGALAMVVAIVTGWYGWVWRPQQVRPNPRAIVDAMFPAPKDGPHFSDPAIIRAIMKYGDVNGHSEEDGLSFLTAASVADRRAVFEWLIAQGATPNPVKGLHPLHAAINVDDERTARRMLKAGSKWSAPVEGGGTVEDWARRSNPRLLERLMGAPVAARDRPATLPTTR